MLSRSIEFYGCLGAPYAINLTSDLVLQVGAWCNLIGLEISLETIPDDSPEAWLNPCTRGLKYARIVFAVKKTPNWLTFHKARCLAVR